MNILVTLDYEIYFGPEPGSAERCILAPTERLAEVAERRGARFVFFVDCGYLLRLEAYAGKFEAVARDRDRVTQQLQRLAAAGHDLQLHIHPHWEDTVFDGKRWVMNVSRYKLADFSDDEIVSIVSRYKAVLQELTPQPVRVFRAGGWCLQPFGPLRDALLDNGVAVDSSVFRNGYFRSAQYDYDFRLAPDKGVYRFDDDPAVEREGGRFTEYPIASVLNSPLFFWRLFLLGRLDPRRHKPLGDGRAMPAPGWRRRLLTRYTRNCLSIDGYNARLLGRGLHRARRRGHDHLVILGHPKALSPYSLEALDRFIGRYGGTHNFTTFNRLWNDDTLVAP